MKRSVVANRCSDNITDDLIMEPSGQGDSMGMCPKPAKHRAGITKS
ncbi:MAG: hypothetical protein N3B12_06000 [Armatimonadetes bacterium]|nr:hypothetical protein [Armatimonadota bacterium]